MTTTPEEKRKEIEALLVFLANDTLEGEERREVEAAVAADSQLAGELDALKAMRTKMQAESLPQSPGEFGLARLMRDVEAEAKQPEAANQSTAPRFWKIAAVVAFGLFVAQSAYFGYNRGSDFELATGATSDVIAEHTIRVAFDGSATEADIRNLLLGLNIAIVDGPSALGLYTLSAMDEASRLDALEQLMRSELVESAE